MRRIVRERLHTALEQRVLCHYGTKGMKWGVRNYQQYGHGGYIPKGMSGFSKDYGLADGYSDSDIKLMQEIVQYDGKKRPFGTYSQKSQTAWKTAKSRIQGMNPTGSDKNCGTCGLLYDVNSRDIGKYIAYKDQPFLGTGRTGDIDMFYKGDLSFSGTKDTGDIFDNYLELRNSLLIQGEGARGIIAMNFAGATMTGSNGRVIGHVINYEVANNRVLFIDGQNDFVLFDDAAWNTLFCQTVPKFPEDNIAYVTVRLDQNELNMAIFSEQYSDYTGIKKG